MLQSPYFLYRTELGTAAAGATKVPLNDWEVGAKLAFSITNTMPDDALFAAAAAGQLHDSAGVAAQAKRLLDGPTGTAGLSNFNLQVYRLGTYDGITRDPTVFPDFKPNTPAAMKQEVLQFLDWIFAQGRGIKDFYTTPVGLRELAARPALRRHRQLLERPAMLTQVDLDPTQRSGLLTQAGVPVVLHLGGQRAGHHPSRRVHRDRGSCARRCRRPTPPPPRTVHPRHAEPDQPATCREDDRERHLRRSLPRRLVQSARIRLRELRRHRQVPDDGSGQDGERRGQLRVRRAAQELQERRRALAAPRRAPRRRTPATCRT